MKPSTKKITLSTVSVLVVLSLLAGITMAWFTDTEKTETNFSAGVLNVEVDASQKDPVTNAMEFENLRPLTLDQFKAELNETDFSNVNQEGFEPTPKYFHPVTIRNAGSLPAQVVLSMFDNGACKEQISNVVDNDVGGVKQDGVIACADAYTLKDVLQILVYKNTGTKAQPVWTLMEGVNLNEVTGGGAYQPYNVAAPLAAGEEAQFIIAGYLPQNVGNAYQAKHYHGAFNVTAGQADEGALIPGGGGSNPEQPDKVEGNVTVQFVTDKGLATEKEVGSYQVQLSLAEGVSTTLEPDASKLPGGYVLDPENGQSETVLAKDGAFTPDTVKFNVKQQTTEVQVKINYFDVEKQAVQKTASVYPDVTDGQTLTYTTSDKDVVDNLPDGYTFSTVPQTQSVTYPDDFKLNAIVEMQEAVVTFNVKKISTGPVEPDNPSDCPYAHIIHNADELNQVRNHMSHNFVLANNIDLSSYSNWTPLGYSGSSAPTEFSGTFDGNGYKITGLNIEQRSGQYIGLFATNAGSIHDLTVEGATITGYKGTGAIVGVNRGALTNCIVSGGAVQGAQITSSVNALYQSANYIGGLAGQNTTGGTIIGCSSSAYVEGVRWIGGLVGANMGTIEKSYVKNANINTKLITPNWANNAAIMASNNLLGYSVVGGLAGENQGTISNCYAVGSTVQGWEYVGGLVGRMDMVTSSRMINCYCAEGGVNGYPNGYNYGDVTFTPEYLDYTIGCYQNANQISGIYCTANSNKIPASGTSYTTASGKLKQQSTYSGYDFASIWTMNGAEANNGYPVLQ